MRTFSTSNSSIAALLITLYPRLPTGPNDNRCHLQVHESADLMRRICRINAARNHLLFMNCKKHNNLLFEKCIGFCTPRLVMIVHYLLGTVIV